MWEWKCVNLDLCRSLLRTAEFCTLGLWRPAESSKSRVWRTICSTFWASPIGRTSTRPAALRITCAMITLPACWRIPRIFCTSWQFIWPRVIIIGFTVQPIGLSSCAGTFKVNNQNFSCVCTEMIEYVYDEYWAHIWNSCGFRSKTVHYLSRFQERFACYILGNVELMFSVARFSKYDDAWVDLVDTITISTTVFFLVGVSAYIFPLNLFTGNVQIMYK